MSKRVSRVLLVMGLGALVSCASQPQGGGGGGGNAFVQFGTVSSSRPILVDSFIPMNTLIAGNVAMHPNLPPHHRNARPRSMHPGIGAPMSQPLRTFSPWATHFTIDMMNGSTVRVVTDQRHIRPGDCVSVERIHNAANLRRRPPGFCEPENVAAVNAVASQTQAEALACDAAKQQLVDAQTMEAADLAARKMELLCDE